jgi:hypothetical protein
MKATILLAFALTASAQSLKPLRAAEALYAAASTADILTSRGNYELNPMLGRGNFGPRQTAISLGLTAGAIALTEWSARHHGNRKLLTWLLLGMAGARATVAVRNARMQ